MKLRRKWVFAVAFAPWLAVCCTGCSQAVLEGVEPLAACRAISPDLKVGRRAVDVRHAFAIKYRTCFQVSAAGRQRVRVQVLCTSRDLMIPFQDKRHQDLERVALGQFIEMILREAGGRVVGSNVDGLQNIQPVHVRVGEHHADVIMTGAKPKVLLSTLAEGLGDVAWYNGRMFDGPTEPGLLTKRVEEMNRDSEDSLAFTLQPQHTMGYSPRLLRLQATEVAEGVRLRLVGWNTHENDAPLSGKPREQWIRKMATYLLGRIPQARAVSPHKAATTQPGGKQ